MLGFAPIAGDAIGAGGTAPSGVVTPPAPTATLVTLTGPSSGEVLQGSAPFTVGTDYPVTAPVAITPYAVGGGYFAPNSVILTPTTTTATFLYVADSVGSKSINVMNGIGLTQPGSIAYTATPSMALPPVLLPQAGDGIGSYAGWKEEDWKKRQDVRDTLAEEIRAAAAEVEANAAKAARAAMLAMKAKKATKKRSRYF